jgi:hypothetical protein
MLPSVGSVFSDSLVVHLLQLRFSSPPGQFKAIQRSLGACGSMSCEKPSSTVRNWRDLYLAALHESDKQRLPSRIAEAERALLARSRELLLLAEHRSEEGKELDKGLYGLRALRDCVAWKTSMKVYAGPLTEE